MIFVTVGTHEQPFDRLIKEVDGLKREGKIQEEVFVQTGYSSYIPQHCKYKSLLSYEEMETYMHQASCVITHGGPATFMRALVLGKKILVVPRQKRFGEHINDHQVEFIEKVASLYKIPYIKEVEHLEEGIWKLLEVGEPYQSNQENFCRELAKLIEC